jgi:uncharacterized membrane protein YiaA
MDDISDTTCLMTTTIPIEVNEWIFLVGFSVFVLTVIADIAEGKLKPKGWYISEIVYTIISILAGFFISKMFNLNEAMTYIVVIGMGLFGSSIIRNLLKKEDEVAERISDTVIDKIAPEKEKHQPKAPPTLVPNSPPKPTPTDEDNEYLKNL